ncbi:MAG TPA: amidohydrolase family protein [Gemmatimonadales bacterium]
MRRVSLVVSRWSFAGLAVVASQAAFAQAPTERVIVIKGATIVPVVGERIPEGDVIIRGQRIEAVGRNLPTPPGATVIEARGLSVYPGFIDSGTQLGLTEIGSVPGGNDTQELGEFNPHNIALTAVNPHSELIPVTRVNGVTSVITAARGGLVSGFAALIDLDGWTPDEMAVAPRVAMWVTYPRVAGGRFGRREGGGGGAEQVSRQVTQLKEHLGRAKAYAEVKRRVEAGGRKLEDVDLRMEALVPVVEGRVPVVFEASSAAQIRGALAIADSFGLKPILAGATEAWALADTLAARKVPVIVGPTTSTPGDDDPYDMIYANPGVLARAGVSIAFRTNAASNVRNLPYEAALAVAYGLDADEALRSVTINPARIWGVADRLGSIEPGRIANLMVTTGDPLDVRTEVRHVFIRGVPIPMIDRHTELYEKFRARPKP